MVSNEADIHAALKAYVEAPIDDPFGVDIPDLVQVFQTQSDDRVCPICEELDGESWDEDDPDIEEPPVHPNCRCYLDEVYDEAVGKTRYTFKLNKESNPAHDKQGRFTSLIDVASYFKNAKQILQIRHGDGKVVAHRKPNIKLGGDLLTVKQKNLDNAVQGQMHALVQSAPQLVVNVTAMPTASVTAEYNTCHDPDNGQFCDTDSGNGDTAPEDPARNPDGTLKPLFDPEPVAKRKSSRMSSEERHKAIKHIVDNTTNSKGERPQRMNNPEVKAAVERALTKVADGVLIKNTFVFEDRYTLQSPSDETRSTAIGRYYWRSTYEHGLADGTIVPPGTIHVALGETDGFNIMSPADIENTIVHEAAHAAHEDFMASHPKSGNVAKQFEDAYFITLGYKRVAYTDDVTMRHNQDDFAAAFRSYGLPNSDRSNKINQMEAFAVMTERYYGYDNNFGAKPLAKSDSGKEYMQKVSERYPNLAPLVDRFLRLNMKVRQPSLSSGSLGDDIY